MQPGWMRCLSHPASDYSYFTDSEILSMNCMTPASPRRDWKRLSDGAAKGWSLGLATLIVFFAGQRSSPAATSLSVGTARGYPGLVSDLPVLVRQASNVVAVQFDVAYDPTKVSAEGASLSTNLQGRIIRSREIAPGVHRTIVYSLSGLALRTNATVGSIMFRLPEGQFTGSGPIRPQGVVLTTGNAGVVGSVGTQAGQIFVSPVSPPDVNGAVSVFFPAEPEKDYVLFASENLVSWSPIATNLSAQGFVDFIDVEARLFPRRFYRSAWLDGLERGFLSIRSTSDGLVQVSLEGFSERRYAVETSLDLSRWQSVGEVTVLNGRAQYVDSLLPAQKGKFYRVRLID